MGVKMYFYIYYNLRNTTLVHKYCTLKGFVDLGSMVSCFGENVTICLQEERSVPHQAGQGGQEMCVIYVCI